MTRSRRIAHIDMDAFFASCELSQYPELRGLPMVVAGRQMHAPWRDDDGQWHFSRLKDYVGRGVLTTATYEARALGVHSAMPAMKAAKLAPDAILLPANFELYRQFSSLFKDAVRTVSPIIENIGIDEVYADITSLDEPSAEVAMKLKKAVFEATKLTCSVGIGPNKLLAKLASDMHKPDGYTILNEEHIPSKVWPMPVSKMNGIGPKASQRLHHLQIQTVGDVAACEEAWLIEHFGKSYGSWLHRISHGIDNRPVVTHSEPVSMSRETTFERDLHAVNDKANLSTAFTRLCEQVAADLNRKNYRCRKVGIKLRFDDFKTVTRDLTLESPTDDALAIRTAAGQCLKRIDLDRSIRLLGVKAGSLQKTGEEALAPEQFKLDF